MAQKMVISRRRFLGNGLKGGLLLGSGLSIPAGALSSNVYTVAFSGTACTRDEGEVTRPESDKRIYLPEAGYIPVRINQELGGYTQTGGDIGCGQTVRGVGENDWAVPRNSSENLLINGPLDISLSNSLLGDVQPYSGGNQYSTLEQLEGYSMPALALHGANLAASSVATQFNFIGHSRGACECVMAAWFLYAYGNSTVKNIPINIFAIDPVPGPGYWYGLLTQLPPNVNYYVGVYSWDHLDTGFQAVVPRPNGLMRGESNDITLHDPTWWQRLLGYHDWKYLADDAQQQDPLVPSNDPQPQGYELYACRGKHGTVAGNTTADGKYDPNNLSDDVAPVPALIYKMARGYLTQWGTSFQVPSAIQDRVRDLRRKIHRDHRDFDKMGGGETRNSSLPDRPWVRRVSSIYGSNPLNTYFMDNVVGDPPYKLAYPVTKDRTDTGWVNWKFL